MKTVRLIALLSLAWGLALAMPAQAEELALRIGRQAVRAEVADTPEAQHRGLMYRERLCPDCGMLFVFPAPARYGFWMKNARFPLAIAFIGNDGRIINIAEMRPNTLEMHYPEGDALYTLEMNGGWFDAHGIKPGDRVDGLPFRVGGADGDKRN